MSFLLGLLLIAAPAQAQVLTGVDALEHNGFHELQGKRVGLITNQTGKDRSGKSTLEVLAGAPGVSLRAFFAPEHGASGNREDEDIAHGVYTLQSGSTIPLYSLYGPTKTPTAEMLADLDALVFDIQDIGARFYTYSTTMALALEAAKLSGKEFVVLDRPNPITGAITEGAILEDSIRHFTAYLPVPTRHGLTMGELATLHNAKVGARLTVVKLSGWKRSLWYDQTGLPWTRPSPNMPDVDAATLYPGIGCFEASNIAVGRGTPIPFRWIGAPWIDDKALLKRLKAAKLPGIKLSRQAYTPGKSVYQGEKCRGLKLRITDRNALRPLHLFVHLVCALRDNHPTDFQIRFAEMPRLVGTNRFQELYEKGAGPEEIIALFDQGAADFQSRRSPYLLYPEP